MRTITIKSCYRIGIFFIFIQNFTFGQVGINTITPDLSSLLEISSDHTGLLVPRMNQNEKNAILGPAESLIIYNTNDNGYEAFDGTEWSKSLFYPQTFWAQKGNASTIATNYLGTEDNKGFVVRTNGVKSFSIEANAQVRIEGKDINHARLHVKTTPNTFYPAFYVVHSNGFGTSEPYPVDYLAYNEGVGSVTGTYAFSDTVNHADDGISVAGMSYVLASGNAQGLSFYAGGHPSSINDRSLEKMKISVNAFVGIGVTSPASKLHIDGDIFIADVNKGLISKSPSGSCWRMTVDDSGNLISTQIPCP